jgi:hypothetical protein
LWLIAAVSLLLIARIAYLSWKSDPWAVTNPVSMYEAVEQLCRSHPKDLPTSVAGLEGQMIDWSGDVTGDGYQSSPYLIFTVTIPANVSYSKKECKWEIRAYLQGDEANNVKNYIGNKVEFRGEVTKVYGDGNNFIKVKPTKIISAEKAK